MVRPDFFIIGAPKCGTTALSQYLREHPRIGFSEPKEPVYFCADFPDAVAFSDDHDYLEKCFGHCLGKDFAAVGEGSTTYFYSPAAIMNILAFQPRARFIVMLRNPLEVVPALHAEKLLGLEEDVQDFERAWHLAEERRRGNKVPKHCPDPRLVDYPALGRLGMNLQRIFGQIPEERRRVIVFDDFVADTRRIYREVLDFLGVPDDGREDFPKVNERKEIKNPRLYRLGHRPPSALMGAVHAVKSLLGVERLNILPRLRAWTLRPARPNPVSPAMRGVLKAEFAEEIMLLEKLLDRDFSHWRV